MKIKATYHCVHCNENAHEYEGLEGSLYLKAGAPNKCPKGEDNRHDFQPDKKTED